MKFDETFNPDALTEAEFNNLVQKLTEPELEDMANDFFPQSDASLADKVIAFRDIRAWLLNRRTANFNRSINPERAQQFDSYCDVIYDALPEFAKW